MHWTQPTEKSATDSAHLKKRPSILSSGYLSSLHKKVGPPFALIQDRVYTVAKNGQFGFVNPRDAFDFGTCTEPRAQAARMVASYSSLFHFDGQNTSARLAQFSSDFLVSLLTSQNKIELFRMSNESEEPAIESLDGDLNPKAHTLNGVGFYEENKLLIWGKKVNIEMVDLEKKASAWKSKCGRRDELNLRVPILNRDVCIEHASSSLWATDGLSTIKVFDIARQRKPVSRFEIKGKEDVRLDRIRCSLDGRFVYISDVLGTLSVYDSRKTASCLKRLRHSLACYSDIVLSADGKNLATVGLDRHFRGYRLEGGVPVMLCERYLKTKLYSLFVEGDLQEIQETDQPFLKKMGSGYVSRESLDSEKQLRKIHLKDRNEIKKIDGSRKEVIQIMLKNRMKGVSNASESKEEEASLKKVKTE